MYKYIYIYTGKQPILQVHFLHELQSILYQHQVLRKDCLHGFSEKWSSMLVRSGATADMATKKLEIN